VFDHDLEVSQTDKLPKTNMRLISALESRGWINPEKRPDGGARDTAQLGAGHVEV